MVEQRIKVYTHFAGSCPYLRGKDWVLQAFELPGDLDWASRQYENLLSRGWRRNATELFLNCCPGCAFCVPLRIPVRDFRESKSQRRARNLNSEIEISIHEPRLNEERLDLYQRYQEARHPKPGPADPEERALLFKEFFCSSCVHTAFMEYRLEGKLLGIGVVDLLPDSISSVYFMFDPQESARRLGVYSILKEIDLALETGRSFLHLGFWVPSSPRMEYKADFFPQELGGPEGWFRRNQRQDPVPIPRPWQPLQGLTGTEE